MRLRALLTTCLTLATVLATAPGSASADTYPPNPFGGRTIYVDPASPAARDAASVAPANPGAADDLHVIASRPTAHWFGDWNPTHRVTTDVRARVDAAGAVGAYPVLVAYNIPKRDCGGHSGGGAASAAAYRAWITAFREGIGDRPVAVILEPDALALLDCLDDASRHVRLELLAWATRTLSAGGNVAVYIDAGHADWVAPDVMAQRLIRAGVLHARGFSLNVSSFGTTADQVAYGRLIAPPIGWKRFVVDTSRNGRGPATGMAEPWCNPPGRGLGAAPTSQTGDPLVDAFLWIKTPGESDGSCQGGPPAGVWWRDYALGLVDRAS